MEWSIVLDSKLYVLHEIEVRNLLDIFSGARHVASVVFCFIAVGCEVQVTDLAVDSAVVVDDLVLFGSKVKDENFVVSPSYQISLVHIEFHLPYETDVFVRVFSSHKLNVSFVSSEIFEFVDEGGNLSFINWENLDLLLWTKVHGEKISIFVELHESIPFIKLNLGNKLKGSMDSDKKPEDESFDVIVLM